MEVLVLRQPTKPDWTLSKFYFDNVLKGFGVEDEKRTIKVKGETCVPEGKYELDLRVSPKFSHLFYRDDKGSIIDAKLRISNDLKQQYHTPHEMVWVKNVPGFEYVLWHFGNTDDDTEGCYIVGTAFGIINKQEGVTGSRSKYKEIYPLLWQAIKKGKCTVEYKNQL